MAAPAVAVPEKDHWSPVAYTEKVAPFVPLLTTKVVALLDPQPTDTILDLGCGDGILTSRLSHHVTHITGLDSSPSMLASALSSHSTQTTTYLHQDVRHLAAFAAAHPHRYTKLFSNAALHWILRDAPTRAPALRAAHDLLLPGGAFTAELGAHGNIAEVHAALLCALVHRGVSPAAAAAASPWWFPTEAEMRGALVAAGFEVLTAETELRQTVLTRAVDGGGVAGWVRLFGVAFLQLLPTEEEREAVVQEVVGAVEAVGGRVGGEVAVNYVRLRFVARRPEE